MADSLWIRLRKVPWDRFNCAPGTDKKVPKMLENLSSRKQPRAMKAAHELWSALCSGGIQPAAEPSTPFLVEILGICKQGVQSEILDILLKLSQPPSDENTQALHQRICQTIHRNQRVVTKLTYSSDDHIAGKAKDLIKQILVD
jgi:hypothetical protein